MRAYPYDNSWQCQVCTCNTNTRPLTCAASFPELVLFRSLCWAVFRECVFSMSVCKNGEIQRLGRWSTGPPAARNTYSSYKSLKYIIIIYYSILCLTALSDSFTCFRFKHVKNNWTAENSCIGLQNTLILKRRSLKTSQNISFSVTSRVVLIDDSLVYQRQSEILPVADATDNSKTIITIIVVVAVVVNS